jgi:hypothetical protein
MNELPAYVSLLFVLTTIATLFFFFAAIRSTRLERLPQKLLTFLTPFWLLLTGFLALGGFYAPTDSLPPRVFAFGALPAILVAIDYLIFFRKDFIDRMSLKVLTMLHVVRVPVEIVLLWLFQAGLVPRQMTFEGWNFDILSGLTAPIIYWLAFRKNQVNRPLLIVWNLLALGLLTNVVTIAVISFKSPVQQIAFEQPNIGVALFPYIWLPTVIVPIVFFSHLASLYKLITNRF